MKTPRCDACEADEFAREMRLVAIARAGGRFRGWRSGRQQVVRAAEAMQLSQHHRGNTELLDTEAVKSARGPIQLSGDLGGFERVRLVAWCHFPRGLRRR